MAKKAERDLKKTRAALTGRHGRTYSADAVKDEFMKDPAMRPIIKEREAIWEASRLTPGQKH